VTVGLCVEVGFFGAAGVGFVLGPCVAAGVAELGCAVPEPEVFAAGAVVDCASPDRATPDQPAISNTRRMKRPELPLSTGNEEEEPDIIPLYADLLSTGVAGEPVA
jgi:hypothetical protein